MTVEVGDIAPDFTLRNEINEKWTLSEQRGKNVVLVFYPFSFSGICTYELHQLKEHAQDFDTAGAEVVGISVDTKYVQNAYKKHEGLTATLLADFNPRGEVGRLYGVYNEEFGFDDRGSFVIDKDGRVVHKVVTSIGEARDLDQYLDALRACPV